MKPRRRAKPHSAKVWPRPGRRTTTAHWRSRERWSPRAATPSTRPAQCARCDPGRWRHSGLTSTATFCLYYQASRAGRRTLGEGFNCRQNSVAFCRAPVRRERAREDQVLAEALERRYHCGADRLSAKEIAVLLWTPARCRGNARSSYRGIC
jgi:hypothetical protein